MIHVYFWGTHVSVDTLLRLPLAVVTNVSANTGVQISALVLAFSSLGRLSRSRMAGLYGKSMFCSCWHTFPQELHCVQILLSVHSVKFLHLTNVFIFIFSLHVTATVMHAVGIISKPCVVFYYVTLWCSGLYHMYCREEHFLRSKNNELMIWQLLQLVFLPGPLKQATNFSTAYHLFWSLFFAFCGT